MMDSSYDQLHRRNRELSILNSIAQALNRETDLAQALRTTLAEVAGLLGLETGWVWLLREGSGEPYLAAAQNLPPALSAFPRRMEGSCHCLDTYRSGDLEGAANINVLTCSRLKWLQEDTYGLKFHASIPLYAHGKKLGVLNVASRDWRQLSGEDLEILHTVGDILSIAIERARLFGRSAEIGAVEERNRLAREIHDTLAQGLTGILLQLETVDAMLEDQESESVEKVQAAIRQARDATRMYLEEARRSVLNLRAAPLEGRTLVEALRVLVGEVRETSGVSVSLETTGGAVPLPARIETGIFRIAQEALANTIQHAGAKKAGVSLNITPTTVRLEVADDGRGFEVSEVPPGRFGLIGMRERARLMGGELRISSNPSAGTRVEVQVALNG